MGKTAKVMLGGLVVLGVVLASATWYLKHTHQLESAVKDMAEQMDATMKNKGYKPLGVGTGVTLLTSPSHVADFNKIYGTQCEDQVARLEGVWENPNVKVSGYVSESTVNVLKKDESKPRQSEARQVIAAAAKEARYALTHAHEDAMAQLRKHNIPSTFHNVDQAALGHLYTQKKPSQPDPKVFVEAAQRLEFKLYGCVTGGQVKFMEPIAFEDASPTP